MPNFIGIGAQKCATTWIYEILRDHPQVSLSHKKEIDYFSYHFDHGIQWYQRNFPDSAQTKIVGEISPSYFHEPAVPERVKSQCPDAKLILSLRDPLQRAISNHKHEVRVNHFEGDDLSFEAGMANNPMYIEQGLYAKHYSRWCDYFTDDQILVVFFEDIVKDRHQVAKRIYRYLEIDDTHRSSAIDNRSNPGHVNRFSGLEKFRNNLHHGAKSIGLDSLWNLAGKSGLKWLYGRINKLPADALIPPIKDATKKELRTLFAQDNRQLMSIIEPPYPEWLNQDDIS